MRLLPEPFETLRRDSRVSDAGLAAAVLGACLVPGLLGAAETVAFWTMAGEGAPVWRAFAMQVPQWLPWALLLPAVLWLGQRVPLRRERWVRPLALHGSAALVAGLPYAAVAGAASKAFSPFASSRGYFETVLGWYLSGLPVSLLTYFAILGAGWAAYWFARHRSGEVSAARLEAQLADARLAALRMQLHPHFLFNSLNAVTVLVRDRDVEGAERAVHLLAELLRESLRSGGPDRVPLSRELDFTRRYLDLETLRFSDRLHVEVDATGVPGDPPVPALVLQPLVENALRHGIAPSPDGGTIEIGARCADGRLVLTVRDDGAGLDAGAASPGTGLGLRNVRERLSMMYGDDASLALAPLATGGVEARVVLPLETDGH